MTNADKIRSMTDDELANWLCVHMDCYNCEAYAGDWACEDYCRAVLLEWLKQEVIHDG